MIFGNESISYYSRSNVSVWMLMSFQAGVLNIGGFMACHRFVSHVTGFATFFGYELTRTDSAHAIGMLIVPIFFLLGAMISGFLVDTRLRQHKNAKYYLSFGFIFVLLLAIFIGGVSGKFGQFGQPLNVLSDYYLLILLCLSCGIQNGTITTVSKSVVRTTHLTGITTDLGIGLVRLLNFSRDDEGIGAETKAIFMRLGIILFFVIGSVFGGYVFSKLAYWGFIVPVISSGFLFFLMLYFQLFKAKV